MFDVIETPGSTSIQTSCVYVQPKLSTALYVKQLLPVVVGVTVIVCPEVLTILGSGDQNVFTIVGVNE